MKKVFTMIVFLLAIDQVYSQAIKLLGDINPGSSSSLNQISTQFTQLNDFMIFSADDGEHGSEPWVYDGESVRLLRDINNGVQSSLARYFVRVNNVVLFIADDGMHGVEWWVTDGTTEGTQLLIDLNPGSEDGVDFYDWHDVYFYEGFLLFTGSNEEDNFELWKTDGTALGTSLVKNIAQDNSLFFNGSYPTYYVEFKDKLVFSSKQGLWETDGTGSGTKLITTEFEPTNIISMGEYMLMIQNHDLIRSDGTANGTYILKDLSNVTLYWNGPRIRKLGDIALFPGDDGIHGDELWKTDGTIDGTQMVIDLDPGSGGIAPQNTVIYQGKMYYRGSDGLNGSELWRTDGTPVGTEMVKDFDPGSGSGFTSRLFTDDTLNYLFLKGGPIFETELWISDGTTSGTFEININPDGESDPSSFYTYKDKVFFFARTEDLGYEPYLLDPEKLTSTNEENLNAKLTLFYPNPCYDMIKINSDNFEFDSYSIQSMEGHILQAGQMRSELYLSKLKCGTFIITLWSSENRKYYSEYLIKVQ